MTSFEIVMFGRDRDTYEPVDHLYALLGLIDGLDIVYCEAVTVDHSQQNRTSYWNAYTKNSVPPHFVVNHV